MATKTGVEAWLGGCTKQELRDSTVEHEPNISFVRHADWDMQVENPGAPPAPPAHAVPLQKVATGAQSAVSKATDGGEQSSANGSGSGKPKAPLFECKRFGCSEMFEEEQWRDEHQKGCGGLVDMTDSDMVDTDVEEAEPEALKKRPVSPGGAAVEDPKKARHTAPVNTSADPPVPPVRINVRVQNERGGESMVVMNQVQFKMYEHLKSKDGLFMQKIASPSYAAVQEHFVATILGESRHSGTLQREANRSEDVAKQALADLRLSIDERKKMDVASKARESVLTKQAIDLSIEVSTLKQAASTAESRCEARLRSLREELEGQQESIKSVLVGMVKQLGLEDRVAGKEPSMHTHYAPRPTAPPMVTPPTEAVTEDRRGERPRTD